MGIMDTALPLGTFTEASTGESKSRRHNVMSYQATVTGTGAVSATVLIEVSNDEVAWIELGSMTPSGTTSASDYIRGDVPWLRHRARCTAISGTGASVTITAAGGA